MGTRGASVCEEMKNQKRDMQGTEYELGILWIILETICGLIRCQWCDFRGNYSGVRAEFWWWNKKLLEIIIIGIEFRVNIPISTHYSLDVIDFFSRYFVQYTKGWERNREFSIWASIGVCELKSFTHASESALDIRWTCINLKCSTYTL